MIDAKLYPDIVANGGLAATLMDVAHRRSITLAPVSTPEGPTADQNAVVETEHGKVVIIMGLRERAFVIDIVKREYVWASGVTKDLSDVVRVADYWHHGATLRELHATFGFMTYNRLAQGYEDGNPVQAQWEDVLEDPELTQIRPLLQAARENDRLGRLFPAVTHLFMARFLSDHVHRAAPQVRIAMTTDGGYEVDSDWVDTPHRVATIDEAIDTAVAQLPSD